MPDEFPGDADNSRSGMTLRTIESVCVCHIRIYIHINVNIYIYTYAYYTYTHMGTYIYRSGSIHMVYISHSINDTKMEVKVIFLKEQLTLNNLVMFLGIR